ncbi:hypothetical protein [Vibrio sp. S17_S38]|uniref:hypothetical protein n=1 Tax=Vibrio sp. S17_S38 TaxID=2720229 RepID=UPI00406C316A
MLDWYFPCGFEYSQMMIISMEKKEAGHSRRLMKALWEYLEPLIDTRFIIVCEGDVNIRDWNDVIWAVTTRMDPTRDTLMLKEGPENSYIRSKMGLDATNKWPGEAVREWGTPIKKDPAIVERIDSIWKSLNIFPDNK